MCDYMWRSVKIWKSTTNPSPGCNENNRIDNWSEESRCTYDLARYPHCDLWYYATLLHLRREPLMSHAKNNQIVALCTELAHEGFAFRVDLFWWSYWLAEMGWNWLKLVPSWSLQDSMRHISEAEGCLWYSCDALISLKNFLTKLRWPHLHKLAAR